MILQAPKNFKKGRYILNRYRLIDAVIIVISSVLSLLSIIAYLNVFKNNSILVNLIVLFILLLPVLVIYILYSPLPTYFNVLDLIIAYFKFQKKQKSFKWEGIHQFDQDDLMGGIYEETHEE